MIAVLGLYFVLMCSAKFDGDHQVRVFIPENSTAEAAADSLRSALGDDFGGKVVALWRLMGMDASAGHGSYVVEPGQRAVVVARRLDTGRQTPVTVTLNNMRTLGDLADKLSAKLEADSADFNAAIDGLISSGRGYERVEQLPAAFVPDSYEFYWTDSPEHVVNKLVDSRDAFWTTERRAAAKKMGLTPVEVAIVASIVEEESNKADERPLIARLYLNRYFKGMKLQADPTVKFAVGDFSLRRITGKHLAIDSPYNTYRNQGLPPGPIRIAEKTAMDAVLNAPQHSYLYMCAKEDFSGRHNFAEDYATHLQNARRYQEALNQRGIK